MEKSERNDHNLSPHVIEPTASGWQKAQNDHNLSLCAIRHDCFWMAKSERNDHNLSPHVTWPQGQYDRDCGAVDKSEAFAPTYPQWGTQTYVVLDNCETKIVSTFSSLKCKHALLKRQNFQLMRATYYFRMKKKQCVYRGRRVCWWNFLITINEILGVSISLLNDHLKETLGSTKIEENHSKYINLTRVSVSF